MADTLNTSGLQDVEPRSTTMVGASFLPPPEQSVSLLFEPQTLDIIY